MKKPGLILIIFIFSFVHGQNNNFDSLWKAFNNKHQTDTSRLKAIHALAKVFLNSNPDSVIILAEKELKLAQSKRLKKYEAKALNIIGTAYENKSDTARALIFYLKALKIREEIKDIDGLFQSYKNITTFYENVGNYNKLVEYGHRQLRTIEEIGNKKELVLSLWNLGNIYSRRSNYPKALDYYLKSLKTSEMTEFKWGIGSSLNNIANIYSNQGDNSTALLYYLQSLKIWKQIGNQFWIASVYGNIGIVYKNQSKFSEAMKYTGKALQIFDSIGDKNGVGGCYFDLASIHKEKSDYNKALDYFLRSLKFAKEDNTGYNSLGKCYEGIGSIYLVLKDYDKAIQYLDSGLKESKKKGEIENEISVHQYQALAYSRLGNYKEAYESYVKFKLLSDSVFSTEKSRKLNELSNKFAEEKREVEQAKEDTIVLEQKKRQQYIIYGIVCILLIVLVFSVLLLQRFKITKKQKNIIEEQKQIVEEKQHEILDSISYAKRLQEAILPPREFVNKNVNENFIFYQPKDIVAGDFYWAQKIDDYFYVAAADSTGHGVPGAMVSVVCSNALNRSVKEFRETETGKILDKTRELVIETFEKSESEVKDGMDISLLRIQKLKDGKTEIQWSGAYNPLWYYVNNDATRVTASTSAEANSLFFEVKADKRAIGKHDDPTPFKTHSLTVTSHTTFYLFSDGYADQFSAADKKLMTRKFKEILASIQHLSMEDQGKELDKLHKDWKGNMEQTDDVLVIGIRI